MYPVTAVELAVGEKLVAEALSPFTLNLIDCANKLSNVTTFDYTVDWDDGDITSGVYAPATPSTTHTWTSPGTYRMQVQTVIGGALQSFSWWVTVVWARASTTGSGAGVATPWVAAVQTSLRDNGTGIRHVLAVAPKRSNPREIGGTTLAVGDWGAAAAGTLTVANLERACDDALCRLQAAYANGLGRMPTPRDRLPAALALSFPLDQLCFGSNDPIRTAAAIFELQWREAAADPAGGLHWPFLADAASDLVTAGNGALLADLDPEPWAVGAYIGAGDKSVRMAEVMRWNEYALRELDDNQTAANVPVWSWRRQTQQGLQPPPQPDWAAAWAWEAAQVVSQVASRFVQLATDDIANFEGATALLFANPANGQLCLRLHGGAWPFWAVLQVGPAGSASAEIAPEQMALEAGGAGGQFVAGRAVAVGNTATLATTMPPYVWDVGRAVQAFSRAVAAESPVVEDPAERLMSLQDGQTVTSRQMPDGTLRRSTTRPTTVGAETWTVVDVVRSAMPLPDPQKMRSGMRPHALLNLLASVGNQTVGPGGSAGLNVAIRPR